LPQLGAQHLIRVLTQGRPASASGSGDAESLIGFRRRERLVGIGQGSLEHPV
jgi:hypothetical protein